MFKFSKCTKCGKDELSTAFCAKAKANYARNGNTTSSEAGGRSSSSSYRILEIFKKFDSDGNGVITLSELKTVLQALPAVAGSKPLTEDDFNKFLEAMDENHDGVISFSEFTDWLNSDKETAAAIIKNMKTPRPGTRGSERDTRGSERKMSGPERFFYDKSTYTGTHTHGGPSTIDKVSEAPAPVHHPSPKPPPAEAKSHSARPAAKSEVRGPERFFYDKSSYTGTHAHGGPEHVAVGHGTSHDQSWKRPG